MGVLSDGEIDEHAREERDGKFDVCAWLTDTHFLPCTKMRERVIEEVLDNDPAYVFIGGDISAIGGHWVIDDIRALAEAFSHLPVYYVLGNHDMWGWTRRGLERELEILSLSCANLHRLDDPRKGDIVIKTIDGRNILLRGECGWYDGWPDGSPKWLDSVFLDTHFSIDLRHSGESGRRALHDKFRNAKIITRGVTNAVDEAIILTHFPPWREMLRENEKFSIISRMMKIYDANTQLGKEIEKWHEEMTGKDPNFLTRVFCGHTHVPADEAVRKGLYARVGKPGVNLFVL